MPGVKALRKIQLARETTSGTIQAATTIWRGLGTLQDDTEVVFPEEDVGIYGGVDRAYIPKEGGTLEFEEVEATFEQLPYIFEASIKAVNTGTVDTGGSGKVYTYPLATNAAPTINTYTLEGGDNLGAEVMPFGHVSEFKLSGAPGEAVKVSATWNGSYVAPQAFTGALAIPAVEEVIFSKGTLYIDDSTIGTTTKSDTLMGFELNCPSGWAPVPAANGSIRFSSLKYVGAEPTLDITFEHDASSIAEKAKWKAGTRRLIRLLFNGTALTTAGTFTYKTLRIDGGGKWESFEKIDESDGNDVVTGTFRFRPDTSGANYLTFTVVNQVSPLT